MSSDRSDAQHLSDMAIHAQQVLDNPAFREALRLMREATYSAWKSAPIRDTEGLILLKQVAQITDKVEGTLRGMLEAGKLADVKLAEVNTDSERTVRRGEQPLRRVL